MHLQFIISFLHLPHALIARVDHIYLIQNWKGGCS